MVEIRSRNTTNPYCNDDDDDDDDDDDAHPKTY